MKEQAPTPPAAAEREASLRKPWVKPEIQELDHEFTNEQKFGSGSDGTNYSYSATV